MTPDYATDLLARDTVGPTMQPDASDPRPWMHAQVQWVAAGVLLGGLLLVLWVWRRRRGRA